MFININPVSSRMINPPYDITAHEYQLRFPQTEDLVRKLSSEDRIQKYLIKLGKHHPPTLEHSLRVGLLCVDVAIEEGFKEKDIRLIGYAGLLHDVGKSQIPLKILNKEGTLTSREREVMNNHPVAGFEDIKGFGNNIRIIVIGHHEYQIYSYPRNIGERRKEPGRKNKDKDRRSSDPQLERLTQILAGADLYDALRHPRSYKPAIEKEQTRILMIEHYCGDPKYIGQLITR